MASNIDATKPQTGIDQPVSVVRNNFAFAKIEIEELQNNKVDLKDGLVQLPMISNSNFPPAADCEGCMAYSTNEKSVLFSDGTDWINLRTGNTVNV